MDDLYQEQILDHANNPHNKFMMNNFSVCGKGDNPSCGDSATLYFKIKKNDNKDIKEEVVEEVSFVGEGCAISTASISMLTDKLKGMKMSEIKNIMPASIYEMLGINISPARVNCALLSYRALEQLLLEYDKINIEK